MFYHNLKYSLKTLFRDKGLIFWTFAFPILLGLFFNLAFSDIEKSETLDIIDIAIIDNYEYQNNTIIKEAFKELGSSTSNNQLFNIKYVDIDEANKLLDDNKIEGYLLLENNDKKIMVKENGVNATVIKSVVDELSTNEKIINELVKDELSTNTNKAISKIYENVYKKAKNLMTKDNNITDISSKNLSYTVIEFYTLIAMSCLYGGTIGLVAISNNLANMSDKAKRKSISPTSKSSMLLSSLLASYIVQIIGVTLLLLFLYLILKIDFGTNPLFVIILTLSGSLAGLTTGVFIGTVLKCNESVKTGIIIAITMFFCCLAGMMGITLKYVIDTNIPILNIINPANMITDGFYSLYYYETLNRFWFNIASLLIYSLILILISYKKLRRQKYDSI